MNFGSNRRPQIPRILLVQSKYWPHTPAPHTVGKSLTSGFQNCKACPHKSNGLGETARQRSKFGSKGGVILLNRWSHRNLTHFFGMLRSPAFQRCAERGGSTPLGDFMTPLRRWPFLGPRGVKHYPISKWTPFLSFPTFSHENMTPHMSFSQNFGHFCLIIFRPLHKFTKFL